MGNLIQKFALFFAIVFLLSSCGTSIYRYSRIGEANTNDFYILSKSKSRIEIYSPKEKTFAIDKDNYLESIEKQNDVSEEINLGFYDSLIVFTYSSLLSDTFSFKTNSKTFIHDLPLYSVGYGYNYATKIESNYISDSIIYFVQHEPITAKVFKIILHGVATTEQYGPLEFSLGLDEDSGVPVFLKQEKYYPDMEMHFSVGSYMRGYSTVCISRKKLKKILFL